MSGAVKSRTSFIQLARLLFAFPNWGDDMNNNMTLIDAAVGALGSTLDGIWDNDTAYIVGNLVVDADTSAVYECLVAHTTPSTGTFADERTAQPTYWTTTVARPAFRGAWTTATAYHTNEFVTDAARYGVVTQGYTSGASYNADVAGGKIITLVDFTSYGTIPPANVALNMLRVNAGATAYELQTPSQVRTNIAAFATTGGALSGDISLDAVAGTARRVSFTTSGVLRWALEKVNSAESGGNAGSGFTLSSYNDAGTLIGTALSIIRATMAATFGGALTVIGKLSLATPTTSIASANFPHGVAPSAPVDGDVWTTTLGMFVRINGATQQPLIPASIHVATSKGTLVDADEFAALDSASSFSLIRITYANLKAAIATYIQTLAVSFTQAIGVNVTTAGAAIGITSTDASASSGPDLVTVRDSASPAVADFLASFRAFGKSSTNVLREYASIGSQITDPTNASEDAVWNINTVVAGALATRMTISAGAYMAGATGTDKGVGTFNATGLYVNGTQIPFSKAYESAQQTITNAGALTLAHGLGVQPKLYAAFFQCTTAELGYSIGDEVAANPSVNDPGSGGRGHSLVPDATNINVRYGSVGESLIHKTSGVWSTMTAASWRLVVRAWA